MDPVPTRAHVPGRPNPAASQRWGRGDRVTEVACAGCGKAFLKYACQARRAKAHYCARACQISARTGDRNPNWRGGGVERRCNACDKPFVAKVGAVRLGRGLFCSVVCKNDAQRLYPTAQDKKRINERRRSRRLTAAASVTGRHTDAEWQALLSRNNGRCARCSSPDDICRDHIVPLAKGGTDHISNIQPLCRSCNARKGTGA